MGLPLLLHHHHHHPPPTPFPPQSPKNSGLHVPARSHLLCFYPESKASSPKGCGTQTRRHSGRGGDRRGARPQAPGGGGQREQGGRTGNTAFLQNPRGWGGAGTRPPTETGLRRQWRPSRLDAGLQGSTAPGVVAPLRSLSSPDTGTRERTEPAGLQHGPPVITGRGRTGPHQAHCVLCGGCGSHGAISWTSAPGAADLQLREVGPVAGPTRSGAVFTECTGRELPPPPAVRKRSWELRCHVAHLDPLPPSSRRSLGPGGTVLPDAASGPGDQVGAGPFPVPHCPRESTSKTE